MILSLSLMLVTSVFAMYFAMTHPRTFALFLLPAGLLHFGADVDGAAGLADLSAVWLLILIIIAVIAVLQTGEPRVGWSATEVVYLVFLAWCAIESFRAQQFSFAARGFMRLLFPFLSMYLARRAVDSTQIAKRLLNLQFSTTLVAGIVWIGGDLLPAIFAPIGALFWNNACYCDHAAIFAMLAIASWKVYREWRFGFLGIFLVVGCLTAINRTTILALAVAASVFAALEYRKLAIILLPALYLGAGALLFSVPAFREKMFYQPDKAQSGSMLSASDLTSSNFNSDGRFVMWDKVLSNFFWPNPLVGSGLGATQAWFYNGGAKEELHSRLMVEHSDYVKLASDTGIIGLSLFVLCLMTALVESISAYRRAGDPATTVFAIGAICAIPAFMVCMAFDNALLYVLPAAQYPLALAAVCTRLSALPQRAREGPLVHVTSVLRPNLRLDRRPAGLRFGGVLRDSHKTAP